MSQETKSKAEEETNLQLITGTISVCISSGATLMNDTVTEAARAYYLSIVNDQTTSIDKKQHKLYNDLVLGTKSNLINLQNDQCPSKISEKNSKLALSYRVGLENDKISTANAEVIFVGQYEENGIFVPSPYI